MNGVFQVTSIWPYFVNMLVLILISSALRRWRSGKEAVGEESRIKAFRPALESLRGVLAVSVFFHHAIITYFYFKTGSWTAPPTEFYRELGPGPVLIFFFLTGFLFWRKMLTSGSLGSVKEFYLARAKRILPAYYFLTLFVVFFAFYKFSFHLRSTPQAFSLQLIQWIFVGIPFGNFPSINEFLNTGQVLAGVVWTLRFEILFYLILPVIAWFSKKNRTLLLVALAAMLCYFLNRMSPPAEGLQNSIFLLTGEFLNFLKIGWGFGMIAAYLHTKLAPQTAAWMRSRLATFLALALLILHFVFPSRPYSLLQALLLFPVFFVVTLENDLFGFLSRKSMIYLGQISYSFYLSQGLFLFTFSRIYQKFTPFGEADPLHFWLFTLISSACTLLFSALVHEWVERPFFTKTEKMHKGT